MLVTPAIPVEQKRDAITGDLVVSVPWLTTGTLAWLLALNMGRQRCWRR